jgi:hypothetical protein
MTGIATTVRAAEMRPVGVVRLTHLLRRPIVDGYRYPVGEIIDVVTDRCDGRGLVMTGLVASIEGHRVRVPTCRLTVLHDAVVVDGLIELEVLFERRPKELQLVTDVLGRSLLDWRMARVVRARDVELIRRDDRWVVAGVEVQWGYSWYRLGRRHNHQRAHRTWAALEPVGASVGG